MGITKLLNVAISLAPPILVNAQAPAFTQVIVFGDSLSDDGNIAHRARDLVGFSYPSSNFNYSGYRSRRTALMENRLCIWQRYHQRWHTGPIPLSTVSYRLWAPRARSDFPPGRLNEQNDRSDKSPDRGLLRSLRPQLRDHTIQISYSKIDHPCLAWVAEILGVARKWRENSGSRLLDPRRRVVIARRVTVAEHLVIPRRQGFWVLRVQ